MDEIDNLNNFNELKRNIYSYEFILSILFCFIDLVLMLVSFFILKSKTKIMKSLKIKLSSFFIIDGFLFIIHILAYQNISSISNDLFFSLLYSWLFLLIISSFEIISNYLLTSQNEEEKINPYKESFIFLIIIFSYNKLFSTVTVVVYIVENVIRIKLLLKLKNYLQKIFNEIVRNTKNVKNKIVQGYIINAPFLFFIMIIGYYFIKLLNIVYLNNDINLYITIILNIFKIATRIMVFSVYIIILFLFDKIIREQVKVNNKNKYLKL